MGTRRMKIAACILAAITAVSAWGYAPRTTTWEKKKGTTSATPKATPKPTSTPRSVGGITVETKDGVQSTGERKELTAWSYDSHIKAKDVEHYLVSDFIDEKGNFIGKLDPNRDAKPIRVAGSNWYQVNSISQWLQDGSRYHDMGTDDMEVMEEPMLESTEEPMAEPIAEEPVAEEPITETSSTASTGAVPGFSGTTVQVEGIDEADIIKTDGKYIYYLGRDGVAIVQAGEKPKQVSKISPIISQNYYKGYRDLYISGNKLVIIASAWDQSTLKAALSTKSLPYIPESKFFVYDISDASKPKLVRTVAIEGDLRTTRLYNNTVYFVTSYWGNYPSANQSIVHSFPLYLDTALSEDAYVLAMDDIYLPVEGNNRNYNLIGGFHLSDSVPIAPKAYADGYGNPIIYMSKNALYFGSESHGVAAMPIRADETAAFGLEPIKGDRGKGEATTFINRFDLTKHGMTFAKTGSVPGTPLNQYSLDEYDGNLRIATTNYNAKFVNHNNLYVLDAKTLEKKGELTNLAENESIQSARFRGKTAYMVTYETIDPLFVIDLSDPAKPTVAGELKIPGFSTYLHPYGNRYLIGVGRDTKETYIKNDDGTETVTGAIQSGIKLSLFDISNPQKPTEVNKLVVGGPQTYSPALHDPKSIMFDMKKGIMAFPISFHQQNKVENETATESWNGGIVIGFNPKGFEIDAKMKLDTYFEQDNTRFVYIGNQLYYVSNGHLVVMDYHTYKILDSIALKYETEHE